MFNQIFYGYERLDSGAASPGRRGELSDARDPQDGRVQTAMDRSGRVVVIVPCLPPLSFNPLPPLHRGEGYKEGGTVWNRMLKISVIGYAELKVRGRKRKGGLCGLKKICENLSHLWSKKKRLPNPLTKAWERWM
jgi:hypothetical protein